MFTTTDGIILPTTVTGSWPRPAWFTEGLRREPFSSRMNDLTYREQFSDAVSAVISDQERAGLDILTNGDYHHDQDLGGRSWLLYPVERLGGVTPLDDDATSDEWAYPPGSLLNEVMGGWRYPGVTGPIAKGTPLELAKIWRTAQARTDRPVKIGVVSAQVASSVLTLHTDHYGADKHQLMWDMATEFNAALRELAAAGCKAIQIEEPLIHFTAATSNDRGYIDFLVECFNHEVSGLDGVEVWAHTCWGNPNMQRVLEDTSYENSVEIYMERLNIDVWTIEAKDNTRPPLALFAPYRGNSSPQGRARGCEPPQSAGGYPGGGGRGGAHGARVPRPLAARAHLELRVRSSRLQQADRVLQGDGNRPGREHRSRGVGISDDAGARRGPDVAIGHTCGRGGPRGLIRETPGVRLRANAKSSHRRS